MARFFKFHSVAEIEAECQRLGLDIAFATDFSPLNQPVQLGAFVAGNRWCVQPMEGCDGTRDGDPGELTFRRFRRFGAGGAKLIWGEANAVVPEGRANPRQLVLTERNLPLFARLVDECRAAHDGELVIGLQLTHSGRHSVPAPLVARIDESLDARTRGGARVLSDDELDRLVPAYVAAAKLAGRAGFQFVDVKQCHGYLLNELLGARSRPGKYGGSFANRTRLARDIITAIRAELSDVVVATRLNVYDGVPHSTGPDGVGLPDRYRTPLVNGWGVNLDDPHQPDLAEPLQWLAEQQRLGVALVNVTLGNPYVAPHYLRPFETPPPDAYHTPEHPLVGVARHFTLTAAVQRAFPDWPIVGSGYSYLQEYLPHAAAANVGAGRVTFAGVGRATLAQPDFVRQLQEHGALDRKRICRTFSFCTALMRAKHNELGQYAAGCPPFDKEAYADIWQEVLAVRRG